MSKKIDLLNSKNIYLKDLTGIQDKLENHPIYSYKLETYSEMMQKREKVLNENRDYYFKALKKTIN